VASSLACFPNAHNANPKFIARRHQQNGTNSERINGVQKMAAIYEGCP
jgi:hypothetical protein